MFSTLKMKSSSSVMDGLQRRKMVVIEDNDVSGCDNDACTPVFMVCKVLIFWQV